MALTHAVDNATGRVVAIGECMVELARGADGRFGLSYGGDTFNTSVYLARSGVKTAYATRLGDDPYSASIIDMAASEGVATDLIGIMPGRNAGLYLIETSPAGERRFYYWRDRAPARQLFEGAAVLALAEALNEARLIYLSGITLSLYDGHGLDALEAALRAAKSCGAQIAIDGNYRPRGWGDDAAGRLRARATFERFFRLADVALPSMEDEQLLWGDTSEAAVIDRVAGWGIGEIVLKQGPAGAIVRSAGATSEVPCAPVAAPRDTTAAGDSFNAAYLAARLRGRVPEDAARAGHTLAAAVIQHPGAIIPRTAMPL